MGVPGRIGDLQPFAELARGGATIVYKAHQESLDRTVLLKVLRPEFSRDEEMAERFEEEARMIARIQHPNVVTIHDFGRSEEGSYFVTEYVEGTDLEDLLERDGRLPVDVVVGLAVQAARGLRAAHRRAIVHGDVKPANLLLSADGRVKLTDFGLASSVAREVGEAPVSGTPGYIAPELIRGEGRDAESDLFGLGVLLYECVTGRPAFPGATTGDRLDGALNRDPMERMEMAAAVPEPLRDVLSDLLAKDPDARIPDAAEAVRRLERVGRITGTAAAGELADYLADPKRYEPVEPEESPSAVSGGTGDASGASDRHVGLLLDAWAPHLPGPLGGWYEKVRVVYLRLDRSRRRVLAVLGTGLLVLVAGALGWWMAGGNGGPANGSGASAQPPSNVDLRSEPYASALLMLADTGWVSRAARTRAGSTDTSNASRRPLRPPRSERAEPPPAAFVEVAGTPGLDSVRIGELLLVGDSLGRAVAIEPGRYVAHLYHAPYPVLRDTVEVTSGQTRSIRADFHTRVGWLTVSVNPWGAIYLDGVARDTIPPPPSITYMLEPGSHRIVVENPSRGRSDTVSLTVPPGDTLRRSFDFLVPR